MGNALNVLESGAQIADLEYEADITAHSAVVAGASGGVALPAAANAAKFLGFAKYDGSTGDVKPIHVAGGRCLAKASGAVAFGEFCEIADNTGKIKKASEPQQAQLDAGLAVAANQGVLTKEAMALTAVKVTAGTTTGYMKLLPRGAAVVTGQAALSADGTKINFAAADAVTAADVEYIPASPTTTNIVAKAMGDAADGDLFPVMPIHGLSIG